MREWDAGYSGLASVRQQHAGMLSDNVNNHQSRSLCWVRRAQDTGVVSPNAGTTSAVQCQQKFCHYGGEQLCCFTFAEAYGKMSSIHDTAHTCHG